MFSSRAACAAAVLLAAVVTTCCSRGREPVYRRVAVAPFEDLSSEAGLPVKGRALAQLVALSMSGTPHTAAITSDHGPAVQQFQPTHFLYGYIDAYGVHATLQDRESRTVNVFSVAGTGLVQAAFALARAIEPAGRKFNVTDAAAQLFAEGEFQKAATASPQFGPAYGAWVNQCLMRGDRNGTAQALAAARSVRQHILPLEAAQLAFSEATLSGDATARRNALIAIARADPANQAAFRTLAEIDTAARSFDSARAWYREVLARDPAPEVYNAAAYTSAYAGKLDEAVQYLENYRKLRPDEANPLDSLGEVNYYNGKFAEAERYFLEVQAKNPGFLGGAALYKAAWARLMMGDPKRADEHANAFFARRGDPLGLNLHAQWLYITGRHDEARVMLQKLEPSAAAVHVAIWAIAEGNVENARAAARSLPGQSPIATVLRIALGGDQAEASPPLRSLGLGLAAMLANRPADAVPQFTQYYRETPPASPEPAPVLLAWALVEAGKPADARPLLEHYVIPDALGDHPLMALAYPRAIELRKRAGLP